MLLSRSLIAAHILTALPHSPLRECARSASGPVARTTDARPHINRCQSFTVLDLPLLLAQLVVILFVAWGAGRIAFRLGQPTVIGEIVAGIALGPSVLGAFAPHITSALFPADRLTALATVSQLGVLLFMFVVGLRVDLAEIRERARTALFISSVSTIVPFVLGAILAGWLYPAYAGDGLNGWIVERLPYVLFLGAAMSVTAFPVLARILTDLKLMDTTAGAASLASAAIGDVVAWCMLAGVVAVARHRNTWWAFAGPMISVTVFAIVLYTVGRRVMSRLNSRRAARDGAVGGDAVALPIMFALACALVTDRIGVHALFGAFIAGTVMPRELGFARELASRADAVVSTVLLPVFFAYSGLHTEIGLLRSPTLWALCGLVIAVAIIGKFGGATIASRVVGMSWRDSLAVGVLMNTRGLMELVVLNVGLELGVIPKVVFAIMVAMALVTTAMAPPLLMLIKRNAAP